MNHQSSLYTYSRNSDIFVPYPRTCGIAWSIDGHLAIFRARKYKPNEVNERNKKIRNNSELYQFLDTAKRINPIQCDDSFGFRSTSKEWGASTVVTNLVKTSKYNKGSFKWSSNFHSPIKSASTGIDTEQFDFAEKISSMINVYCPTENAKLAKDLAEEYEISGDDLYEVCIKNATLCMKYERADLFRIWNILGCSLKDLNHNMQKLKEWKDSPLGKQTFLNIVSELSK